MISGIAGQHITAAEKYLREVERAFPNLSIESQERLTLADTHLRVAMAYQLQSLEDAIKVLNLGGIDIGTLDSLFRPVPSPLLVSKPWWKFWGKV